MQQLNGTLGTGRPARAEQAAGRPRAVSAVHPRGAHDHRLPHHPRVRGRRRRLVAARSRSCSDPAGRRRRRSSASSRSPAIAQSIGSVLGWLYITLGRAHRQLVFFVVTRPMLIAGYFLGIWWAGVGGARARVRPPLARAPRAGALLRDLGHLRAGAGHPGADPPAAHPGAALLRRRRRGPARHRRAARDRAADAGRRGRCGAAPRVPRDPRVSTRSRADRRVREAGAQAGAGRARRIGRAERDGHAGRRRASATSTRSSATTRPCESGRRNHDESTDAGRGSRPRRSSHSSSRACSPGARRPRPRQPDLTELEPPAAAAEVADARHPGRLDVARRERLRRAGAVRRGLVVGRVGPGRRIDRDAARRGIRRRTRGRQRREGRRRRRGRARPRRRGASRRSRSSSRCSSAATTRARRPSTR